MSTYLQIQNDVKGWLRDLPADTLSAIPGLVNDALRELQRWHGWRCMETSATLTTTPASATLGTIARFRGVNGAPYRISAVDGARTPMGWLDSLPQLSNIYKTGETGRPRHLYIAAVADDLTATLQAWPNTDSGSDWGDGEYRIQVGWLQFLPALTAPDDTNWFTINGTEALRLLTLWRAHALNLDESRAAQYLQMAQTAAGDLRRQERTSRGGAGTLTYATGPYRRRTV